MENFNIQELAQNKLVILYTIQKSSNTFHEDDLTSFILKNEFLNYFFYKQYLGELYDNGFIEIVDHYIQLTEEGQIALEMFSDRLPENLTNSIDIEIENLKEPTDYENSIIANYTKENERFFVNLAIIEFEVDIFNLSLEVPTEKYAIDICKRFKTNPEEFYMNVIQYLEK